MNKYFDSNDIQFFKIVGAVAAIVVAAHWILLS